MYIHPELSWRLAQTKIVEARSRTRHAPALRAASLDRRALADAVGARRDGRAAPMLATIDKWRALRTSRRANAPWTTNG